MDLGLGSGLGAFSYAMQKNRRKCRSKVLLESLGVWVGDSGGGCKSGRVGLAGVGGKVWLESLGVWVGGSGGGCKSGGVGLAGWGWGLGARARAGGSGGLRFHFYILKEILGEKQQKIQRFLTEILRLESGAKECIV